MVEQWWHEYPSAKLMAFPARLAADVAGVVLPVVNHVNCAAFEGQAAGTLLLLGPEGGERGRLLCVHRPEGWGTEPYPPADFTRLEELLDRSPPLWTGPQKLTGPLRPGRHVEVTLAAYPPDAPVQTLLVLVGNRGTEPLPELSVHLVVDHAGPQEVTVGEVPGAVYGGAWRLDRDDDFAGDLPPGHLTPFVLRDGQVMSLISRQVAALSTEYYCLSVVSAGREVNRVDGRVLGQHVEGLAGR